MHRYTPEIGSTSKTYATEDNAIKAAEKKFGGEQFKHLTYIIMPVEWKGEQRFVPVFIGERAIQAGVHFHFHVLG